MSKEYKNQSTNNIIRGFTLIELLAVIVILAIIALIAVPIVVNIINDSKKESQQRSIELYVDHVQKAITKYQMTHPDFNPKECTIEDKKLTCDGTEIQVEMKGQVPESGTITIVDNKLYYDVTLEGKKYVLEVPPTPATGEDYRGYYADVDGNGTPDGVIYADLNKASESGAQYSNGNGAYTYPAKTNLNEYTISKEKYTEGKFGEKEIIKLKKDKGNPRFYVMALENFTTEAYTDSEDSSKDYPAYTSYYWYYGAYNHMSPLITSNDFGQGKENTRKMIAKWNAAGTSEGYTDSPQNNRDIWKHIQTKYQQGWYIPSRGEWAAFADYFTNKTDLETKLTTSNYKITYGLSGYYWSSSQYGPYYAWVVRFSGGYMDFGNVDRDRYLRLGVTF